MYNVGDMVSLNLSKFAEIYPELASEAIGNMTLYSITVEEDDAPCVFCCF